MPYDDQILKIIQIEKLPIRMPNIEKIMHRGTSFYRCISPSPLCAPARACLASGNRYENCHVPGNEYDYPAEKESFYRVLRDNGYIVGGVGKFDIHKATFYWDNGWIDDLGRLGFTTAIDSEGKWATINSFKRDPVGPKGPYMKYLQDRGLMESHISDFEMRRKNGKFCSVPTPLPDEAYGDTWTGTNGIEMLHNFPKDKPWFLQVNFPGPHDPWDVTLNMKKRWENVIFPAAERGKPEDTMALNGVRQNYAAMLENIDTQIGLLLNEVENRGESDNTIIIYSSDHGEMLGDKNLFGKHLPDKGSIHIPLVFSGPGINKNYTTGALTELTDLSASILDYAGITNKFQDSISLMPVLKGETQEHRETIQSALADWKVIIDKHYKSIFKNGKIQQKFDAVNDPWERNNLI
ncbi:MAG: sulfatase-like hydrolase/transferase [Treponema sp.]|nr:sulfatase-like hydrolase/transferase [Treponema sp.]